MQSLFGDQGRTPLFYWSGHGLGIWLHVQHDFSLAACIPAPVVGQSWLTDAVHDR